jgi:hypothetical protein
LNEGGEEGNQEANDVVTALEAGVKLFLVDELE